MITPETILSFDHQTWAGAPEGQGVRGVAQMAAKAWQSLRAPVVHVCLDDARMARVQALLRFFAPDIMVLALPAWDCLPYDRVSPARDLMAQRAETLGILAQKSLQKPHILLTTVNAITQKIPPAESFQTQSLDLQIGGTIDREALAGQLITMGFERTATVREPGQFAMRGSLIDLYPPQLYLPVRIDCFDDEIETIRPFDPLSQLSEGEQKRLRLSQSGELLLTEARCQTFRQHYREVFGAETRGDALVQAILEGHAYPGMEHWLPLFYGPEAMTDVLSMLPDNTPLVLDYEAEQAVTARREQIMDFYTARREAVEAMAEIADKRGARADNGGQSAYRPLPPTMLYMDEDAWQARLKKRPVRSLSPFPADEALGDKTTDLGARMGALYHQARAMPAKTDGQLELGERPARTEQNNAVYDELARGIDTYHDQERTVIMAFYTLGARTRFMHLAEEHGLPPMVVHDGDLSEIEATYAPSRHADATSRHPEFNSGSRDDTRQKDPRDPAVHKHNKNNTPIPCVILPLDRGIVAPDLVIITEQDIFGDRLSRPVAKRRRKTDNPLLGVSDLSPGDYVVHAEHGIGQFIGLETVTAGGAAHECVKLLYGGDDKLYVPVENIDVLSRYGSEGTNVTLDSMGSTSWQARKAKVKKKLLEMAEALMATAAHRQISHLPPVSAPDGMFEEFCARFPYQETDDQLNAIADVIDDLSSGAPMERLICGDVGFGKTEVAMRAAFLAAMSGLQVAIVVPTTLLARQHTASFKKRFEGFPIRIAQLSRFVSTKEARETKERLRKGHVDIVIGTHALLAEGIGYSNLGLVIIDEEQNFGVKQKERLKALKNDVHVLTLTATPIPRTLQLAMSGARQMSLITTPPVDRLAVRTFIMPLDRVIIREALLREHYRGGQSFYVCPRISDLAKLDEMLRELVPEIKLIHAHGQMPAGELDERMTAFYNGEYDVLLATNIIETGIDIPNANTLIVHRSDQFGLSQLYQIRGRVGRSKTRAYAYLTYREETLLSETAKQRLHVMSTLDNLGAGFQLASYDLDIRGAGNLLGEEQSGHIREVGVELYQQMLGEAVAAVKAQSKERAKENSRHSSAQPRHPEFNSGSSRNTLPKTQTDTDLRQDDSRGETLYDDTWSPVLNLGLTVAIPEDYIPDLPVRMSMYRRLSATRSAEELEALRAEMLDRFGVIPETVENLLGVIGLKHLCKQAGVSKVDVGPKGAMIAFYQNQFKNVQGLVTLMQKHTGQMKLRPDHKLSVIKAWPDPKARIAGIEKILTELATLA